MKCSDSIRVPRGVLGGFCYRRRTMIAAISALVLLPIGVSDAGSRSHVSKHSSRHGKSPKHFASSKSNHVKLAALGPNGFDPSALKSVANPCDPSKFKIVLDVGHTAESEGAISARNVAEFVFNLRLAKRIEEKLKGEGFAETRLLVTEGRARPSLFRRV